MYFPKTRRGRLITAYSLISVVLPVTCAVILKSTNATEKNEDNSIEVVAMANKISCETTETIKATTKVTTTTITMSKASTTTVSSTTKASTTEVENASNSKTTAVTEKMEDEIKPSTTVTKVESETEAEAEVEEENEVESETEAEVEEETEVEAEEELPITNEEYILLCNCVAHEAGSSWIGVSDKACVVEVIMNRVESRAYPNTIEGVITAPYQFSGSAGYAYLDGFTKDVSEEVEEAVKLYFTETQNFNHGYLNFYGDGRANHFS